MLSDTATAALRDIAHHIALAQNFATGMTYEAFKDDLPRLYAVTRCREIIAEASRRLPADYTAVRAAAMPDWSSGPVEGRINRLKTIKRQLYGRAARDLLRRRFLPAA